MDPVSIALTLLMKNPAMASSAYQRATAPGVVSSAQLQASYADLSRGILTCYHKTARFRESDPLGSPYSRQSQYAADNSMVIRIKYAGITTRPYEMVVAVMVKDNKVRTAVLADSATIPYNKKCELEEWTG